MNGKKLTILIIEDNPADARLIREYLAEVEVEEYDFRYASNLSEGLKIISEDGCDLILLDLDLPDSTGLDSISKLTPRENNIALIVFTGNKDLDTAVSSLDMGAQDYLIKGQFDSDILARSISYAIERKKIEVERKHFESKIIKVAKEWSTTFDAIRDAISIIDLDGKIIRTNKAMSKIFKKSYDELKSNTCQKLLSSFSHPQSECPLQRAKLSKKRETRIIKADDKFFECVIDPVLDENNNITSLVHVLSDITEQKKLEEEIKDNLKKVNKTFEQTISVLSHLVEVKDPYTAGHQKMVADIAAEIARDLNFSNERVKALKLASLIHDIGKISIPASILSKPGKITDIERAWIETHPITGYDIVKDIDFPYPIGEIILQHHERINGSGYPNHLKGNDIMLEAKIVAVADVIDAMSSHRPYRKAYDLKESMEEILKNKGILYDPAVVESCVKLFAENKLKIFSN
ncbi:MAG: HD domain-containing protein [Actinobacteria bacterium]|nr:HD domain-containing protein [Actinomycetota bacterium]